MRLKILMVVGLLWYAQPPKIMPMLVLSPAQMTTHASLDELKTRVILSLATRFDLAVKAFNYCRPRMV